MRTSWRNLRLNPRSIFPCFPQRQVDPRHGNVLQDPMASSFSTRNIAGIVERKVPIAISWFFQFCVFFFWFIDTRRLQDDPKKISRFQQTETDGCCELQAVIPWASWLLCSDSDRVQHRQLWLKCVIEFMQNHVFCTFCCFLLEHIRWFIDGFGVYRPSIVT